MVSMSRLAREAGVSLSTVSHLLNGTRRVSDSARTAVLAAVARTGFEDPRLDRASRRTLLVGVVVPSIASPYFAELLEGMSTEAVRQEIGLMLMTSGEDARLEHRALEVLCTRRVDGLAIIPTPGFDQTSRSLIRRADVPVVLVDRRAVGDLDYVGGENREASESLTHHLLTLGHSRIGFIRGLRGLTTTSERETGYRQAHERLGVAVDDSLVVDGHSTAQGGRAAMERLVHLRDRPSAVFCANNNMTVGALPVLRRLGTAVPRDMALVAFDDTEWSGLVGPGITCMAQPFHAMGVRALTTLLSRIGDPLAAPAHVRLPPSYEHRGSCGCVAAT